MVDDGPRNRNAAGLGCCSRAAIAVEVRTGLTRLGVGGSLANEPHCGGPASSNAWRRSDFIHAILAPGPGLNHLQRFAKVAGREGRWRRIGRPGPYKGCRSMTQSASVFSTACRSFGLSRENSARAFLASSYEPVSAAFCRATVAGWSGPQMKANAFAKRPMAARSIFVSFI
jgi:hypothetical protein